jgi:hypothetical protein
MVTLSPCHVSVTPSPSCSLQEDVVTAIGVLPLLPCLHQPNFLSKHLLWFGLTERGSCMHSHSHLPTPGPSSLLSVDFCLDPWLPSVGTCIVSSPWILRSPTFCPWWKRKGSAETKKTLYGTIIHDREVLAPLSFPKQASSPLESPVLSFFRFTLGPG